MIEKAKRIKATNPKELLADYGSEVMALVQRSETERLAQLTDTAYKELCQLLSPSDDKTREKIIAILEAWRDTGTDYIVSHSFAGVAQEIAEGLALTKSVKPCPREGYEA